MSDPYTTSVSGWQLNPKLRLRAARDHIRSSLWVAPGVGVAVALLAAFVMIYLDREVFARHAWLFDGGPESAREVLSTIASSMLTFTALVFSITILALQLASNQFSPRVIRTFLQERVTKLALASFVGTFVYSVVVLSRVRSTDAPFVPAVATWVALVLVLVSVGMFIKYVHRMAHSIRAITVITKIAKETHRGIDMLRRRSNERMASDPSEPTRHESPETVIRHEQRAAVLTLIDEDRLVELAQESGSELELVPRIGDFVPSGADLFRVWGASPEPARCRAALAFDIERDPAQDPAFGFRQLVDIAVRAVSPGINDPSTAVQTLDHLHDLVRRLSTSDFEARPHLDGDGVLRLRVHQRSYKDYVRLAFDEIRDYGASSRQVTSRIENALLDCIAVAPRHKRVVLEAQLELVRDTRARQTSDRRSPRLDLRRLN